MQSSKAPLPTPELRSIAVEASVDPRTVAKVLRGDPVLALPRSRVLAELKKRGLLALIPAPSAAEPAAEVA